MTRFKDFVKKINKTHLKIAGVVFIILLAAALVWYGNSTSQQAEDALVPELYFEAVIDHCTGDIGVDYDGLICHVTHAKPQGFGIDECAIYGDYFYLEALARYLVPGFKKHW